MRLKVGATTLSLCAALTLGSPRPGHAQGTLVWAGGNDNPNTLITARFNGGVMTYSPEIPSGGSTSGSAANLAANQVRVHRGAAAGGCSLIAQTNDATNSISLYSVDAAGLTTPVAGSPFAAGPGVQSLAWAPDGGALYAPLAVVGASQVLTYRVTCTPGGPITVTNAGPVTLAGFNLLRDADVSGTGVGSHLCVSGTNNNAVGCFPIDPVTRLPGTTPVNTITVNNVRGMRIASNGCGVAAVGNANLVAGFANLSGTLFLMNTAGHLSNPRYGAVSPDGSFAAFGSLGDDVALYLIFPATCSIMLLGTNSLGNPAAVVEYVAFDEDNRLYVADGLLNQVRVFQVSFGGLGGPLSTTTTNHAGTNPPGGIDAALASAVPVRLQGVGIQ
jgi:hypothetical protein